MPEWYFIVYTLYLYPSISGHLELPFPPTISFLGIQPKTETLIQKVVHQPRETTQGGHEIHSYARPFIVLIAVNHKCSLGISFTEIEHQNSFLEVPVVVQWVKNLTSIHKDTGLIPGLAQCFKDLALPQAVV